MCCENIVFLLIGIPYSLVTNPELIEDEVDFYFFVIAYVLILLFYAVGTYLSLKLVPAPVSAGVNTIADERFEEFKDREVPPKTKEQIEKDNEKYVREKIEQRLD